MKKYKVITPVAVFATTGADGKKTEHSHIKGDVVTLSETDIAVRALLARKQIVEVPEAETETASEAPAAPATKKK